MLHEIDNPAIYLIKRVGARALDGGNGMNQEKDLLFIERIRSHNDPAAKDELVRKYLPMVRHIVKNQSIYNIDYEDYIQEGTIGLLKAIEEYDAENYHIKFSTFAYICILRRIYNVVKRSFTKKAIFTGRAISLNAGFSEDDPRTVLDLVADNSYEPLARIENEWIVGKIDMVLKAYLSPIEYEVVKLIIQDYSYQEIHKRLGFPPKVIDNARTRAKIKLKKLLIDYGSFLNPEIPLKSRKRNDLSMRLEVG